MPQHSSPKVYQLGSLLIERAEIDGRAFESWASEWLRHCEATQRHPLNDPDTLLDLADCDRYSQNLLSRQVMEWERAAYLKAREKDIRKDLSSDLRDGKEVAGGTLT